jgi:hypothetical protein
MNYSKQILLVIGVALYLMHIPFDHSYQRADIYLFYNYGANGSAGQTLDKYQDPCFNPIKPAEGRYIANILKESGVDLIALIFIFLLWFETKNKFYLCFLIWWAYNIATYFLFYGQGTSIIGLPLLLILIIVTNAKNKKYN